METEELPSYHESIQSESSPSYTPQAHNSEGSRPVLFARASSSPSLSRDSTYQSNLVYRSDGLETDLGPRRWRLQSPAYGFNGIVEGRVKVDANCTHILKVTATLKGYIATNKTERGVITGTTTTSLLSNTVDLFNSSGEPSRAPLPELSFQIPFPTYIQGRTETLPPSCHLYHQGVCSEVSYELKISVVRKGLRRNKCQIITIIYLPKTRPSLPPIRSISCPVNSDENRIKIKKLSPVWSKTRGVTTEDSVPAVSLILPSPALVSAGAPIPLIIQLKCSCATTRKLFSSSISIELIKRSRLWLSASTAKSAEKYLSERDTEIAKAEQQQIDERRPDLTVLHYTLVAGRPEREMSWRVHRVASVEYFIRAVIRPPPITCRHLPTFRCEEPVRIASDAWGSQEVELMDTEGLSVPALGLARGFSSF